MKMFISGDKYSKTIEREWRLDHCYCLLVETASVDLKKKSFSELYQFRACGKWLIKQAML